MQTPTSEFPIDAPNGCENAEGKQTCSDFYNCCSCGGNDCGCRYCFDCHACPHCLSDNA